MSLFAVNPPLKTDKDVDVSSPLFDPSKVNKSDFCNSAGKLKYQVLADAFDRISDLKGTGTGSAGKVKIILTNVFRYCVYLGDKELLDAAYLSLNRIAPEYEGVEVGVGDSIVIKAMGEVFGRSDAQIKLALQSSTDLGEVALSSRVSQRTLFTPPPLTAGKVISEIRAIAQLSGGTSQAKKKDKIKNLLVASRGSEAKYIVRTLQQKLRIGIQAATIMQAIAHAHVLTRPSETSPCVPDVRRSSPKPTPQALDADLNVMERAVREAYCQVPNLDVILSQLALGYSAEEIAIKCHISPGIPVKPMLAKPTKGIGEVLDRLSECEFTCEYKYDGERAQIHVMSEKGERVIKIYSRNSEDMTGRYPDVVHLVKSNLQESTQSLILDSEVVALDAEGKILPFQTLTTRKRKDVNLEDISISVCLFAFDCMYVNGESLLKEPLKKRRERLWEAVQEVPNQLTFAKRADVTSMEEVEKFLEEAVNGSCEGLMVKTLMDTYEPSKRSLNWLKIKKDYIDGLTDSVDLVPIGAFYGKGKRSGVFGAFLLAVYDSDSEQYQTVCKAGTGFSDEVLQAHYKFFSERTMTNKPDYYVVSDKLEPEVWFEAAQVWECKAADLSISPVHTAALGRKEADRGIGLRFPRFIRIREDKNPDDATTSDQIVDMYNSQFTASKNNDDDDDADY